jgi:hypothetical protein
MIAHADVLLLQHAFGHAKQGVTKIRATAFPHYPLATQCRKEKSSHKARLNGLVCPPKTDP